LRYAIHSANVLIHVASLTVIRTKGHESDLASVRCQSTAQTGSIIQAIDYWKQFVKMQDTDDKKRPSVIEILL